MRMKFKKAPSNRGLRLRTVDDLVLNTKIQKSPIKSGIKTWKACRKPPKTWNSKKPHQIGD